MFPLLPPTSEGCGKVLFSVCQFTLRRGGEGVPHLADRGVPHPKSGRGVPCPRSRWGVPQSRSGGGYPHPRSGWGVPWGTPHRDWIGYPPHPPHRMGYPRLGLDGVTPPQHTHTDQHSEHLLRGRRCASCVHTGGLSYVAVYAVHVIGLQALAETLFSV